MNWIDLILILIVLLAVIAGWYRRLLFPVLLSLLVWASGFCYAPTFFILYVASFIDKLFDAGPWLLAIAFYINSYCARYTPKYCLPDT